MSATQVAKDQLKSFVERIERMEEEKKVIADDIRDIYAEAKGNGYDVKALREIVKLRKQDVGERKEHEAILEVYMHALGMLATTELGQAALSRKRGELAAEGRRLADEMSGAEPTATVHAEGRTFEVKESELGATVKGVIGRKLAKDRPRAATAARPDDKLATPPIPIPALQPVAQVGPSAGIRSALPDDPTSDGAERPPFTDPDPMPFQQAAAPDASAPPSQRFDLGGADDLLEIPGFLRRTADNRVPA